MYQVNLQQVPSQSISVVLNNQSCIIVTREIDGKQYFSLSSNGNVICQNILMQPSTRLVSNAYSGFVGDFYVSDLIGDSAPIYSGWGDRWVLLYSAN